MTMVLITALGVGGATVIGAIIGFIFKNISHKFSDIVLSFAAGVMLCASILGLVLPSYEYGEKSGTDTPRDTAGVGSQPGPVRLSSHRAGAGLLRL